MLIINTSEPKASDMCSTVKDPIEILIGLYLSEDNTEQNDKFMQNLLKCRINANYTPKVFQRDDLEYYIPQLCSYIAFHQEFKVENMIKFIKQAGQVNFYFAHLLYFYLRSLSYIVSKRETTVLKMVDKMQRQLFDFFCEFYQNKYLISKELTKERYKIHNLENSNGNYIAPNAEEIAKVSELIQKYGTVEQDDIIKDPNIKIKSAHIILKNYKKKILIDESIQKPERGFTNHQISSTAPEIQSSENGIEKPDIIEACGFASTINFFDDLISVSEQLKIADPKVVALRMYMKDINQQLPAAVYIPFFTQQIRTYIVLNIVPSECRVFSTKERSPFYICLELFSPELEENYEHEENLPRTSSQIRRIPDWKREYTMSSAQTVYDYYYTNTNNQSTMRSGYQSERNHSQSLFDKVQFQTVNEQQEQFGRMTYSGTYELEDLSEKGSKGVSFDGKKESIDQTSEIKTSNGIACAYEANDNFLKDSKSSQNGNTTDNIESSQASENNDIIQKTEDELKNDDTQQIQDVSDNHHNGFRDSNDANRNKSRSDKEIEIIPNGEKINIKIFASKLFGEDQSDQEKRIKKKSPYGHLKSWRLVHFIVKTGDNLKQEQFAQQLIYQFDQIFRDSGLNLLLRPYEIASLGPNCGILEVVKNSVTIDSLKRTLHEQYKKPISLNQFFKIYYGSGLKKAQQNFCSSLAAYSLVCYFLQIKDRHNGNILLHKEGYITHIDFGFLLSNAPGKGLAFENNVPFKLLTEYIDILGGLDSDMFKIYRQLFYKGFMAARKNQDKILILVKMLYSAHGASLPCFEKGEEAIKALEERFNPKKLNLDSEYFVHTNELINQSLDNWKSRWYDKWQYFCQGIFY